MAASTNLFTTAKTVAAKPAKGKKPETKTVELAGLEKLAALDALAKAIKGLIETTKAEVNEGATDVFVTQGQDIKSQPENFKAEEGAATASVQLKKRSSASGLSEIEIEQAKKAGIPLEVVADRPETYIFNPEHLDWLAKNGASVSKALVKLGAPSDVIQFQEASTKTVTTDESLNVLFTKSEKVIRDLLPVVGTLAVKPTYAGADELAEKVLEVLAASWEK
jgi:hypothetical protein